MLTASSTEQSDSHSTAQHHRLCLWILAYWEMSSNFAYAEHTQMTIINRSLPSVASAELMSEVQRYSNVIVISKICGLTR